MKKHSAVYNAVSALLEMYFNFKRYQLSLTPPPPTPTPTPRKEKLGSCLHCICQNCISRWVWLKVITLRHHIVHNQLIHFCPGSVDRNVWISTLVFLSTRLQISLPYGARPEITRVSLHCKTAMIAISQVKSAESGSKECVNGPTDCFFCKEGEKRKWGNEKRNETKRQ